MTGLFLLLVALIWLAVVIGLSTFVTRKLPMATWRIPSAMVVFVVLLPLPLIDEIVGGWQFERLCQENSAIQIDRVTAVGKTVYLADLPDVDISGTWVHVVLHPRKFVDATTGELVVSFNDLIAVGGRFIQTLGISEGGVPLTFKGWCQPGDQYTLEKILKDLNMTLIRRPTKSNGEAK